MRLESRWVRGCTAMLGVMLHLVACSAIPPTSSQSVPVLTATTSTSSASAVNSPEDSFSGNFVSVTDSPVPLPPVPRRTGDASGPFGVADLWIGAGPPPTGVQRSLGPGDLPGPLLEVPHAGFGTFRVYDMCGVTEASFRTGADFSSVVYLFGYETALRFHKGCSQGRFMAVARSAWLDKRAHFRWRTQAERWVAERRAEHYSMSRKAEHQSVVQPANTAVYGFYDSVGRNFGGFITGGPFGIMFAPQDAPIDNVKLLTDTVAVRDGVLRGLVRNWSRHLWAYDLTVSADGGSFRWPLSVQPGEVAPFEIPGWTGPADSGQIDIAVHAEMSWHVDPTRAWGGAPAPPPRLIVRDETPKPLRDSVRKRYPQVTADVPAGSVPIASLELEAPLAAPSSHLSLRHLNEDIEVEDLRGYGVLFDGDGRVIDLGPAPTVASIDLDEDITSLPHPLAMNRSTPNLVAGVIVLFDIHAVHEGLGVDRYDIGQLGGQYRTPILYRDERLAHADGRFRRYGAMHGGFIVWIGAAYPHLDMGQSDVSALEAGAGTQSLLPTSGGP